jgi:hypothetical protein
MSAEKITPKKMDDTVMSVRRLFRHKFRQAIFTSPVNPPAGVCRNEFLYRLVFTDMG